MLSIGVPELVIASKANDHMMEQSPPTYHYSPSPTDVMRDPKQRRPSHEAAAFDVLDLGSMMVGQGVTPIEEFTGHRPEEEPVPGVDVKRHGSGISRPSVEDKRRLVEGWTVNGEISTSPVTSRSVLARRSQESSAVETKKKSVDFDFASTLTRPSDRYATSRKESNTSSYTSSSRSGESSAESPMIYSPSAESPLLDLQDYASGTILDLVSDPQEIREYRHLERKKDLERKGSTASATSSSGTATSRSGSFNVGRPICVAVESANGDSGSSSSPSYRKQSLDGSPHGRRTTLADPSLPSDLAPVDASSGVRPQLPPRETPYPPTAQVQSFGRPAASVLPSTGTERHDGTTDSSDYHHPSSSSGFPISPTSPMAVHNISTNKPLFHPDLHPVADHHASNDGRHTMPSTWSSSSLPEHALYSCSTDVGSSDQTLATLMESSTGDDTSPSSSGTVRPTLVPKNGKPKAQTVADYRSSKEE
ncbi:hypothetical protein QFC19_003578 [Naganishia cerealis]|uniref:Uncharacterized protein n=1 Tax=Naganishia cerealis TaxID=610337 RepID=A0ACC2W410_9TREE|nr:hypothetical protein QFC19_003578 [Naganishia cerealis]